MTYGPLKSENIPVGVRKAGTPESEEDDHGLAALRKKRAKGGRVDGDQPKPRMDRRARGGKVASKGNKINIIIAPQGGPQAPSAPPPMPVPPPQPMPPRPMPGAMPPAVPPQPMPGPARKDGGRVGYPIDASAAGGKGRLEKARAYGKNAKGAAG